MISLCLFFYEMCNENLKFVPKCTGGLHGMGLKDATIKQTLVQSKQQFFAEWD